MYLTSPAQLILLTHPILVLSLDHFFCWRLVGTNVLTTLLTSLHNLGAFSTVDRAYGACPNFSGITSFWLLIHFTLLSHHHSSYSLSYQILHPFCRTILIRHSIFLLLVSPTSTHFVLACFFISLKVSSLFIVFISLFIFLVLTFHSAHFSPAMASLDVAGATG